jgi:hypothetical protein
MSRRGLESLQAQVATARIAKMGMQAQAFRSVALATRRQNSGFAAICSATKIVVGPPAARPDVRSRGLTFSWWTEVHAMKIRARFGFTGSILALGMLALSACAPESSGSASSDVEPTDSQLSSPAPAEAVGAAAQAVTCTSKAFVGGVVLGAGGVPLQYAHLQAWYSSGGYAAGTYSLASGDVGLSLPPATYDFSVAYPGYPTKIYNNVPVACGQYISVTIQM